MSPLFKTAAAVLITGTVVVVILNVYSIATSEAIDLRLSDIKSFL